MLKALLFDLDETLYHPDTGMLDAGDRAITQYVCDQLGMTWAAANQLRVVFTKKYGTTAMGLAAEFGIPQAELYARSVERVDPCQYISSDAELDAMLAAIAADLHVFTNATRLYAEGVLNALGVEGRFCNVFDIGFFGWRPKPAREPYEAVITFLGLPAGRIGLIEDNPANIVPARELGMTTFLLRQSHEAADYSLEDILDLRELLCREGLCAPADE